MTCIIANLIEQLNPDTMREELGFCPEMQAAHNRMFEATNLDQVESTLAEWLNRFQPCLFGRLAAKFNLIRFCILNHDDLMGSDEAIRDKIQAIRTQWTREGYEGSKSGFVILALSHRLVTAASDNVMRQLAQQLCSLYLLEECIELDRIYTDEIFLEKPGTLRVTWKWLAGVNVFSANADRRWWQDHRIPGGIAFSINSVGHMVKSGVLSNAMRELDELLGAPPEAFLTTRVDSLPRALEFAMRTIWGASGAVSGKATELLDLPSNLNSLPVSTCPVELPRFLKRKNYCEYRGYYHTDVTLPSDYFLPDVVRPGHVRSQVLDFTYLFRSDAGNPAYETMGKGRRVRGPAPRYDVPMKYKKGEPEEVTVEHSPRLMKALR